MVRNAIRQNHHRDTSPAEAGERPWTFPRALLISLLCSLIASSCKTGHQNTFHPRESKNPSQVATPTPVEPDFGESASRGKPTPSMLQPPVGDYRLGPEDQLELEIIGEPDTREETFVTPDGRIYYDLLDGVEAEGKSTRELKAELESGLTRFYRNPQVSVTLVEATSQQFTILGRVNSPGNYPINAPMQVLDALSLSGGLFTSRFTGTTEELADLQHSFLVRDGKMLPIDFEALIRKGDLSYNVYLRPDDFIYLPSALTNEVYVLGAVTEPRPVGFMNEMTLTAALGRGLGFLRTARLDRVAIVRGSLTDPKIAVVDASAIMNGNATNIRLEPGDIVYVPGDGSISFKEIGREAVDTFVRVVAANEGGNAGAGSNAAPVGLNVSLGTE